MKRAWLMAVLLAGGAGPILAQATSDVDDHRLTGRGYFLIGAHWLDLDALNRDLRTTGYPIMDEDRLTIGGGGLGTRGLWLFGGEGIASIGRSRASVVNDFRINLNGGYGLFQIGYLAYSQGGVDVYPLLGLGGGGVDLSIIERATPSFNEVLTDPGRSAHLSAGSLLASLSVGIDYRIGTSTKKRGGLLVGVRAGWLISFAQSDWNLESKYDVSGGPEVTLGGPFVRVAIGGWGSKPRKPATP